MPGRDFAYRGGALVATWNSAGNRLAVTTDHLGTPRFCTNASGGKVGAHVYDPFGLELTSPVQNTLKVKLTGHERDAWTSTNGQGDDLDYLHARFFNPTVGRFLSVDPVGGNPFAPQTATGTVSGGTNNLSIGSTKLVAR